jgi:proteasome assembly chaperone 3
LFKQVNVPLSNRNPERRELFNYTDDETGEGTSMDRLPLPHLTATTILGGTNNERANVGQLLAAEIGTFLVNKYPEESRLLVLGLGLREESTTKDQFHELLDLIQGVL